MLVQIVLGQLPSSFPCESVSNQPSIEVAVLYTLARQVSNLQNEVAVSKKLVKLDVYILLV